MKKLFLGLSCVLLLAGCGRSAPDAGEEGVQIAKPWVFGHGGVYDEPVKTGLSFTAITTNTLYVSVVPQTFDIAFNDMMSSDGIPLDFHAAITLQVNDSVRLVKEFSGGGALNGTENKRWYDANIKPVINNYVRDAFKSQTMHSLAIEASGTALVEEDVTKKLEEYIKRKGIPVSVVNFNLGRVNPPEEIKRQRVKTAEEQQRQETEKQTKIAEDNRKAAEQARAEADNAYRQSMQLSPEQFVDLQRIQMMQKVCEVQGHCTFVVGGSALVNIK